MIGIAYMGINESSISPAAHYTIPLDIDVFDSRESGPYTFPCDPKQDSPKKVERRA